MTEVTVLEPDQVGERVSVRLRLRGETGPTGGPATTDVVGRLLDLTDAYATLERRDGEPVRVAITDVLLARTVPPRPRRARRAVEVDPDDLQRIAARGWPATETAPLGDWLLRAAGGFTGRANSVLVAGDPGTSLDAALAAVERWYADRGLPPRAQVVRDGAWSERFADAGWRPGPLLHAGAVVQVADLTGPVGPTPGGDDRGPDVEVGEVLADDWLDLYGRLGASERDTARAVLGAGRVGLVRVGSPAYAIARVALTGEWAGLSCVEVAPAHRRQGLGRRVTEAALGWAAERGATRAYLQVRPENDTALRLYADLGFTTRLTYDYLEPGGCAP